MPAENPESLGLVPESVTRRQEVTLVKTNQTWHSDVRDFEGDRESADLSDDNEEVPKDTIISGLTRVKICSHALAVAAKEDELPSVS